MINKQNLEKMKLEKTITAEQVRSLSLKVDSVMSYESGNNNLIIDGKIISCNDWRTKTNSHGKIKRMGFGFGRGVVINSDEMEGISQADPKEVFNYSIINQNLEKMKHTKGEWKPRENEGSSIIIRTSKRVIAEVKSTGDFTESETTANAKLIAAAPELLYQLQTAVEHIKNIRDKYKPENPFAIGGYETAIKKATQ